MESSKGKVFVGLSGGVDSAVSAALLQREGFAVEGVFIKIWQPEFTECTWREDRLDAMRVAAYLKIPFREIDLSDEYKDEVVADMIDAYRSAITPNPDVLCNERITFGHFLNYALESGADYVA
nr:tRNA 2-thiouridine(34) synthase MnmA [Candidatus Paceibacterota bacterium]